MPIASAAEFANELPKEKHAVLDEALVNADLLGICLSLPVEQMKVWGSAGTIGVDVDHLLHCCV